MILVMLVDNTSKTGRSLDRVEKCQREKKMNLNENKVRVRLVLYLDDGVL